MECSVEGIFKLFRAEYLIKNGFVSEYEGNGFSEAGELNSICRYFRAFVNRNVSSPEEEIEQVLADLAGE